MLRLFKMGSAENALSNIRDFTKGNCFLQLTLADLKSIIFFTTNDRQHLGEYTPKAFADKFHREFLSEFNSSNKETVEKRMAGVRHIYLTCESSAITAGNEKYLAQAVADELYNKGFKKVQVHSYILNEPIPPNFELHYKLFISRTGEVKISAQLSNLEIVNLISKCKKIDDLIAKINLKVEQRQRYIVQHARNADLIKELTELQFLRAEIAGLEVQKKELRKQVEAKAQNKVLLDQSSLETELDKAQHTFIAYEGNDLRKARIETISENNLSPDQIKLHILQHEIFKLYQSLSSEIENTQSQSFGMLFTLKTATKKVKQAALLELLQAKNLDDFSASINRMEEIKNIVCGSNSRVRQLLGALKKEMQVGLSIHNHC